MDQDEFRALAMREIDAVYRLAYHLAPRPQDADDLVQETYLRAFRGGEGFLLTELGLRPWLFKILHNVVNTAYARQGREPGLLDDWESRPAPPLDGAGHDGLRGLDWDGIDERLKAAIHALPLGHREVFLLSAVEGLKYREIAGVLQVPVGTVMSRMSRARSALWADLAELAAEWRLVVPPRPSPAPPGSAPADAPRHADEAAPRGIEPPRGGL